MLLRSTLRPCSDTVCLMHFTGKHDMRIFWTLSNVGISTEQSSNLYISPYHDWSIEWDLTTLIAILIYISSMYNQYKLLWAAAGAATLSFILLFMSEPTHENAVWDEKETKQMMEYLWDHTSQACDGGIFKDSIYQAAATHIAPHHKLVWPWQQNMWRANTKWWVNH